MKRYNKVCINKYSIILAILSIITCLSFTLSAQKNTGWKKGVVVLENDKVHTGVIDYYPGYEVIRFKGNYSSVTKAFDVSKVDNFRMLYEEENVMLNYKKFQFKDERPQFYEEIFDGHISLYRKRKMEEATRSIYSESSSYKYGGLISNYTFYFNLGAGLIESNDFKSEVLPVLLNWNEEMVNKFKEEKNLNLNSFKDQVLLIYNINKMLKQNDTAVVK